MDCWLEQYGKLFLIAGNCGSRYLPSHELALIFLHDCFMEIHYQHCFFSICFKMSLLELCFQTNKPECNKILASLALSLVPYHLFHCRRSMLCHNNLFTHTRMAILKQLQSPTLEGEIDTFSCQYRIDHQLMNFVD